MNGPLVTIASATASTGKTQTPQHKRFIDEARSGWSGIRSITVVDAGDQNDQGTDGNYGNRRIEEKLIEARD